MKGIAMPEDVSRSVNRYTPRCLTEEQWAKWGGTNLDVVRILAPTEVAHVRRMLSNLASFAADLDDWGHSPPIAPLFTVRLIERHSRAIKNVGAQRVRRAWLMSVGRTVNPHHPWPVPMGKYPRERRQPPYAAWELDSLHDAAKHQEPRSLQRLFQMNLALMLGAGCDRQNLYSVTPEMVSSYDTTRVCVSIEGRPAVDVSGLHGQWIRYWAANTEPGRPLAGPKSVANGKLASLRGDDGETRISTARLRTTFVVHLLDQRMLNLTEFMQLTGFGGLTSVDLYATFLEPAEPEAAARIFAALPKIYEEK